MSDTAPTYTLTLTAAEKDALHFAVEEATRRQHGADADPAAFETILEKVTAAKPKKPRATKPSGPKLPPLPPLRGLPPLKRMTVSEMDRAEADYREAAKLAQEEIDAGRMPAAEATLRDLIAIHRSPWRRIPAAHNGRVYVSDRHPGIELREHRSTGIGGITWRLWVNGEAMAKEHFRSTDAEAEADTLVRAFA